MLSHALRLLPSLLVAPAFGADRIAEYSLADNVHVQIVERPFVASQHKIELCPGADFPCKIDGAFPYGTSFDLPTWSLAEVAVRIKGQSYTLDTSGMYNAWGNRPIEYQGQQYLTVAAIRPGVYSITGLFSDGAGTFVAQWHVSHGKARRVLLTADDRVMLPLMQSMYRK